jgi:hypothetical protein
MHLTFTADLATLMEPRQTFPICSDSCLFSNDGICDDIRGSGSCEIGTDCKVSEPSTEA